MRQRQTKRSGGIAAADPGAKASPDESGWRIRWPGPRRPGKNRGRSECRELQISLLNRWLESRRDRILQRWFFREEIRVSAAVPQVATLLPVSRDPAPAADHRN